MYIHRINWRNTLWATWHNCETSYVLLGKDELHGVLREYSDVLVSWCKRGLGGTSGAFQWFWDVREPSFFNLFSKACCDIYVKFYIFGFDFLFSCMLNFIVCPTWTTRTVQHTRIHGSVGEFQQGLNCFASNFRWCSGGILPPRAILSSSWKFVIQISDSVNF